MRWRVLVAIFGAVPATALGVMAFLGLIYGGGMIVRVELSGALLVVWFVWCSLGVLGVVGLWLAALGRDVRPVTLLLGCGLVADGPLVAVLAVALAAGELSWLPVLVVLPPFIVGAVCLVAGIRGRASEEAAVR
jgi:hypothetical protein